MNKRQIYITVASLGLVVVLAGGYYFATREHAKDQTPETSSTQTEAKLAVTSNPSEDSSQNKPNADLRNRLEGRTAQSAPPRGTPPVRPEVKGALSEPDVHDGLTFEQAMNLFGLFGYRYQFVSCRGMPGNFIMKQGVKYMLDNRDPITHNFQVASDNFLIPGYDFAIGKAHDLGNHMITCDGGGASSITIVP
ncbi:MAG: hypothetical protein Q8N81_04010 [bacterium]|nr:hypothetical protein [bacterium]